jgi:GTP-binding protein Era
LNSTPYRSGVVAIIGRPNVGKSTLLNQLLKQKIAIVSPKPQTTRNRIMGIVTGPEYQIILLDTPGLHEAREEMNRQMVRVALDTLTEADAVLFIADSHDARPDRQEKLAAELSAYLNGITCPMVLALNKIDLVPPEQLLPLMDWYRNLHPFTALVPLSALKGDGVETLLNELMCLLPEGPQYYPDDIPTDASERFIAAEIIREKVFLLTRDEIPYSSAVIIESFAEGDPVVIQATILVERDSQKGILVGRKGAMLAAIRKSATTEIEELLACKVRLHLWIKVSKNWTANPTMLRTLGLG